MLLPENIFLVSGDSAEIEEEVLEPLELEPLELEILEELEVDIKLVDVAV